LLSETDTKRRGSGLRARPTPFGAIRPWAALLAGLAILGAACGGGTHEATKKVATAPGLAGNIRVLAAASLTDAFNEIGKAFEAANTGVHVKFSYDVSSTLATQANSDAPADVFASADDANMLKVTAGGNAPRPRTFVRNALEIVVRKGNPKGIQTLVDLNRSNVAYMLCAVGVPCGTYGKQALDRVGVTRAPASYDANTKGVVSKVTSGQADAGIVYVTDVKAAAADGVAIPEDQNIVATYPIAVLKQSPHPDAARAFVDYVLSPPGQATLAKYGFLPAK
jgi:molybdate transport system substrate-binding protein